MSKLIPVSHIIFHSFGGELVHAEATRHINPSSVFMIEEPVLREYRTDYDVSNVLRSCLNKASLEYEDKKFVGCYVLEIWFQWNEAPIKLRFLDELKARDAFLSISEGIE